MKKATQMRKSLPTVNEVTIPTVSSSITVADLNKLIIRPLGSPINAKAEGDIFPVTMTGKIEVREFKSNSDNSSNQQPVKKVYFTTVEGFVINVNRFNEHLVHTLKEGHEMTCVCRISNINDKLHKYCQFVLNNNKYN